jgi:hypothetical protein
VDKVLREKRIEFRSEGFSYQLYQGNSQYWPGREENADKCRKNARNRCHLWISKGNNVSIILAHEHQVILKYICPGRKI